MKFSTYLPISLFIAVSVSCAPQGGGGDGYDVSNPYAAPDYVDDSGSSYQPSDVNPVYDAPAVYEDTASTPAVSQPAYVEPKVHTVVRGDTLWGLSKQYGVSVASIKQANGLSRDTIVLGTKLKIPAQ